MWLRTTQNDLSNEPGYAGNATFQEPLLNTYVVGRG